MEKRNNNGTKATAKQLLEEIWKTNEAKSKTYDMFYCCKSQPSNKK